VKPENILVLTGYDLIRFKLVDFGSITELLSVNSRAGTANYLAPERFHEAPISERTEIFAIGVTLYEALTGTFPFGEIERFQAPHFHAAKLPAVLNPNIRSGSKRCCSGRPRQNRNAVINILPRCCSI
jgi:serine/threonine protein kinase